MKLSIRKNNFTNPGMKKRIGIADTLRISESIPFSLFT